MTRDPWPLVLTMLATLLFGLMANAVTAYPAALSTGEIPGETK